MPVRVKKSRSLEALNITALIDVVFLLLIFFLVATRFAEEDRELDVDLPTASEAKPWIEKPREVFVNIDEQGRYFVNGQALDLPGLHRVMDEAALNNPLTQTVVIRADKKCSWDAVVSAFDTCHQAGIHNIIPTTRGAD
ncbi:MAG: biopolymer transporter ExbD [Pirellulaceae bacterium]|nr:biopolymer transporter ExbD [Planctomycetales bacterium]